MRSWRGIILRDEENVELTHAPLPVQLHPNDNNKDLGPSTQLTQNIIFYSIEELHLLNPRWHP